jgi:hypothetical protein
VIQSGVVDQDLGCFFHDGEDPWLGVVIAVCTDTKVDFLRKGIGLVSGCQFEDADGDMSGCFLKKDQDETCLGEQAERLSRLLERKEWWLEIGARILLRD